jgi:hypothetical protein
MPEEKKIWWEEFTEQERQELEAWLAEVNTVNEELPQFDPEPSAPSDDPSAGPRDFAPF